VGRSWREEIVVERVRSGAFRVEGGERGRCGGGE
jgi:hypothetical protein